MTIESVLEEFASSREPGAVVLCGAWGVGKTYLWQKRILPGLLAKPWEKKYSYVSLFGINSLAELKVAIAIATEEFDRDAKQRKRLTAAPTRWFWLSWKWLSDVLGIVPKSGGALSKIADRIGFYLVRNRIICFDDIERHGKQLDLRDFFGMVSYLCEQRGCRVVVILNDGQLHEEDQKIWENYREKVFQGELKYSPSMAQTIDLGLEEDSGKPWHSPLRSAMLELGISNIRLIRRAARFMRLAIECVQEQMPSQVTIDSMARVVAMLVFSVHGRGVGGPPLDRVRRASRLEIGVMVNGANDQRTDEEKVWDRMIIDYRIYIYTDLDKALVDMVVSGFPDGIAMRSAVRAIEENVQIDECKNAWHAAWRLYHDTIGENGSDVVRAFEEAWPRVSQFEHAVNLQSAARLLRALGRSDLATSFIQLWVSQRSGDRIRELRGHELHMLEKIEDEEIISAVDAARAVPRDRMSIRDAFDLMRDRNVFSEDAIASIADSNVDDLVGVIDDTVAGDLSATIRRILELRSNHADSNWVGASLKMEQACKKIAGRSSFAAYRMRNWFGIELEMSQS